jgi:transcription initiation factor TFIIH subunit 2
MGSLTTTDPGNIRDTISQLAQDNIKASVIALAAEVQVLKFLSTQTKGSAHNDLLSLFYGQFLKSK